MGARVSIAGGSGYAGGELLRLVAGHPDLELGAITADSNAGRPVGEVHPNLAGLAELAGRRFEATGQAGLAHSDLVFLALPAGQSAAVAASLPDSVKVVDLGPDFRLAGPAAWSRHYRGPYAGRWPTGLPELPGAREQITAATRVAMPGCYATAAILALAPLAVAGVIDPGDVVIAAASGTSGAGRVARTDLLGSEVMGSVAAYQAGGTHRHIPEIEQVLTAARGRPARVSFTPVLAPMPRGILATCTARLTADGAAHDGTSHDGAAHAGAGRDRAARDGASHDGAAHGGAGRDGGGRDGGGRDRDGGGLEGAGLEGAGAAEAAVREALAGAYDGEPFVCLLPAGQYPVTGAVAGSNGVQLQAAADPRTGRATVLAALDNLGKGAAGQAVQVANLMLGLPETAGLAAAGIAP